MRVFIDANVLFAAAISPDGRSAALFLLAEQGFCELLTSPHAVTEARRNAEVPYPDALKRLERLLHNATMVPEAAPSRAAWARRQGLPEEDAPILAAAADAGAEVLVTGDRAHFGPLFGHTIGGVRVLRLADTLNLVLGTKSGE
ncbi:MAG: putative PIN domain-containing protein [Armatimonadetes bacterium CSP1-3]|nr:MAG: putative PIN domain-containing protein [Armatimonadetes bacterium CSP1-3]